MPSAKRDVDTCKRDPPEDIKVIFNSLGITPSHDMYDNPYAVEVLKKRGYKIVNVLKRFPSDYIGNNDYFVWNNLDRYGPEIVTEVLDKENLLGSEKRLRNLSDYCKLWEDLKRLGDPEKEIMQYNWKFFGDVQDVGFRGTTESYSKILGLTGYAKNMDDWSVECLIQGPESRIKVLKKMLNKEFQISRIKETKTKIKEPYKGFDIL